MDYLKLAIYMIDFKIILFFSLTTLAITCVLYFLIFIPFGIDPFNSEVKNKKLSDYNRNQISISEYIAVNRTHKDKTKEQIKILELELLANKYNLIFER